MVRVDERKNQYFAVLIIGMIIIDTGGAAASSPLLFDLVLVFREGFQRAFGLSLATILIRLHKEHVSLATCG